MGNRSSRMWTRWQPVLMALVLMPLGRSLAAPLPDAATVSRNWRVSNAPEASLLLIDARPRKLFSFTGTNIVGMVAVGNRGDAPVEVLVRGWLEHGLDDRAPIQEKEVTVPAGEAVEVSFEWPPVPKYGHALVVELERDGQVIATGRDYFTVHDSVWAVGIAGNHPVGFTAEHVSDMAGIEQAVERFRDRYTNTFEKFFWAPDDFANMTPEKEQWFSGQARYHERSDRLKHLCDHGWRIGVLPTTYGKSIGSGTGARDVIREQPELVYGYGGAMEFSPDTEELAKWDIDAKPYWQSIGWAHYNMNDPAVVQHGIDEIRKSTEIFGWAGVRFDGHFRARAGKQRVGEEMVDFTPEMADAQTAANHRALKEQMAAVDPRFIHGYNFAECDFTGRLVDNPRESIELCADGGHLMDEYAKQNAGASHPFRKWADYAHAIVKSTEQVRRLGGHYFPMVHSNGPVGRYQNIFTYAAGGHPNGTPWSTDHPYNAFATRYGELLWGENVRNVWNPCGIVIVKPEVMWQDYVREERIDATHTRLIVHLINPPAHETATESQAAADELRRRETRRREIKVAADAAKTAPDYSELENLAPVVLYPEPRRELAVKLVPRALGGTWAISRVLLLDPETVERRELAVDTRDPYFAQVRVPEVRFWAVLVVDLERKEM